ncbi:MAG: hypothetical protein JWP57_81 [Spirosoma sp.]|nr:hypothetical protein [Spirosoma sp.]
MTTHLDVQKHRVWGRMGNVFQGDFAQMGRLTFRYARLPIASLYDRLEANGHSALSSIFRLTSEFERDQAVLGSSLPSAS